MSGIGDPAPSLERLREIGRLCDDQWQYFSPVRSMEMKSWIAEIIRLRALIAGLRPLAKLGVEAIVECAWQACDFDGDDIQATAAKVGAIVEIKFDPAVHEDVYGVGMEAGDPWFEFPPLVLAAKLSLEKAKQ